MGIQKMFATPPEELDPNNLGSLSLGPVPNRQLEIITFWLHTIPKFLWWINERYVCM